jgi:hypothetical protein
MAIKPHCVVCGSDSEGMGSVEFADHTGGWQPPTTANGVQIVGWSNELGVTAPPRDRPILPTPPSPSAKTQALAGG